MIPSNPIEQIFNYAGNAQYCNLPTPEQMSAGVVPLDSLPASWWNKMWADTTSRITEAREAVGIMINELCNVLVAAGICPQCNCLDQLYQSIDVIRKTLATATCPGAVVSSSDANKVAVASDGTMTVNCFGNAAALTTSAHTVVGAINELKSTYDNALTNMGNTVAGKAPISHASADATYGVGTASAYGHLKISDQYTSVLAACSGVAASQKAVADVYAYAANIAAGVSILGNTVAVMDGTASAGTCNTAARSDHVHPWPNLSGSMWYHPDRWDGLMTAYQTDQAYCGTAAGWASYLTFTHSTVAAEYYQQIRFPFWSPPQVHRVEGGADRGWHTIYTTENSCVGAVANTGVVRDGSGHIYANYLNTGNGREDPNAYPDYSLAFVDSSGWHRKADRWAIGVGWASCAGRAGLNRSGYFKPDQYSGGIFVLCDPGAPNGVQNFNVCCYQYNCNGPWTCFYLHPTNGAWPSICCSHLITFPVCIAGSYTTCPVLYARTDGGTANPILVVPGYARLNLSDMSSNINCLCGSGSWRLNIEVTS